MAHTDGREEQMANGMDEAFSLRTSFEDRDYLARQLVEDYEREQDADLNTLMDSGEFDRGTALRLIREGMERMETYLITS